MALQGRARAHMGSVWEPETFTSPCPGCPGLLPCPVITLCSVHMNSPVFTQTECLESGVTRTQVLVWDPPSPPSCCRAVTGLRLTLPGPVSSAAPHCHCQRLPDGHQRGPEQGRERLAHHQRGGKCLAPACPHWRGCFLGEGINSLPLRRWGSSSSSCFRDPCLLEWPPLSLHGTFTKLVERRAQGSN